MAEAPAPSHTGHRARLRARFMEAGPKALADYELLELLLTFAIPRRDVKPLAKDLIASYGSLEGVLRQPTDILANHKGLGEQAVTLVQLISALALRTRRQAVVGRLLANKLDLLDYLYEAMGNLGREEFRVIYLNAKNQIVDEEVLFTGTINTAAVYPREVIKHALNKGATALVLAHNHPSGDPTPSPDDYTLTQEMQRIAAPLHIQVVDHIVIGDNRHFSFADKGQL